VGQPGCGAPKTQNMARLWGPREMLPRMNGHPNLFASLAITVAACAAVYLLSALLIGEFSVLWLIISILLACAINAAMRLHHTRITR
jgi:hypothetical protein